MFDIASLKSQVVKNDDKFNTRKNDDNSTSPNVEIRNERIIMECSRRWSLSDIKAVESKKNRSFGITIL